MELDLTEIEYRILEWLREEHDNGEEDNNEEV